LPEIDHSIAKQPEDLPDKTEEKQPGPALSRRKPRLLEAGGEITGDCLILVNGQEKHQRIMSSIVSNSPAEALRRGCRKGTRYYAITANFRIKYPSQRTAPANL
jgi:hypothetical protein